MTSISLEINNQLSKYEKIYNSIYQSTPGKIFAGNSQFVLDYKSISNSSEADVFFSKYGVGNSIERANSPFERRSAYELLLEILVSIDEVQYHAIHKGTPYYFIGWTAYQNQDFAKSFFYMDAAVSEDLKFHSVQDKTSTRPSLDFFLLKSDPGPSGLAIHIEIKDVIIKTLQDYNISGGGLIRVEDFRDKFISDLLYNGADGRSLLTALYTFLMEYEEKKKQILLRSDTGGSIQPFLDHLFDGARILESLLEKRGSGSGTLYPKITQTPELGVTQSALLGQQTLADAELQHDTLILSGRSFQDINFGTAYIIRNTTGHSLIWPDQFSSPTSYSKLCDSLIASIFWSIENLWLRAIIND
jgi:hypothetical protein